MREGNLVIDSPTTANFANYRFMKVTSVIKFKRPLVFVNAKINIDININQIILKKLSELFTWIF